MQRKRLLVKLLVYKFDNVAQGVWGSRVAYETFWLLLVTEEYKVKMTSKK